MKKIHLFVSFVFLLLFSSCFYDNKEELFQIEPECDATDVTYSAVVKPIIDRSCYQCHSTNNKFNFGAGYDLEDFDLLKNLIGTDSTGGQFLKSIKQEPGTSPMPKGASKLSECNILKIEAWIANGALND